MKLGLSSYSICRYFKDGGMTLLQGMEQIKEWGFDHMELVPFYLTLIDPETYEVNEPFIKQIVEKSKELDLPLSAFSLNADLLKEDEAAHRKEIDRVKHYIDMAAMLKVESMRFDMASFRHPYEKSTILDLERDLPRLVASARELVDYGESKGLIMTMENHGFYLNGADRVNRIFYEVNRPNYKQTLDVGNFLCVDQNPTTEVVKCVKQAYTIHLKDFFIRKAGSAVDKSLDYDKLRDYGWIFSVSGKYKIMGSITGHGDMDMYDIIGTIKNSGFDGNISIEFEGLEDPLLACPVCRSNALAIWNAV